jgi:lipocalin
MMLDNDYQIALVGSKSPKYLWILARTPEVSDNVMDKVLDEASERGYNIDDLIWVDQSANVEAF